ncbi:MAG TPA: hypothetical protein VEQ63_08825 [Bryobacteraceae bacterium]|nr:hypothetical protein [Bryobacteraceae bacterium]
MRMDEEKNSAIGEALRALKESSSGMQAPEHIEKRLIAAFQAHGTQPVLPIRKSRPPVHWWAATAAAAALLVTLVGAAIWGTRSPKPSSPPTSTTMAPAPLQKVAPTPAPGDPEVTMASAVSSRVRLRSRRPARRVPRPSAAVTASMDAPLRAEEAAEEVATSFFPVPYAPQLSQSDPGQVVRVKLPRSSMRTFGLPVSEERMFERVHADVLLGQDGVARAIRFVQ